MPLPSIHTYSSPLAHPLSSKLEHHRYLSYYHSTSSIDIYHTIIPTSTTDIYHTIIPTSSIDIYHTIIPTSSTDIYHAIIPTSSTDIYHAIPISCGVRRHLYFLASRHASSLPYILFVSSIHAFWFLLFCSCLTITLSLFLSEERAGVAWVEYANRASTQHSTPVNA
ncbi:hypothetical protein EDB19DRAFT_1380027 [Suillus lakei]|nr:hypothetical protein EDB19DRAFT_1380027 [Suillus lakei]